MVQHGGKALSYLNLFDGDAAWRLVHELAADAGAGGAVAIIKHANPCGAAVAGDLVTAYERALECDLQSAPSAAWWPSAATSPPRWPRPSRPARRPTSSSPPSYTPEALEKLDRPAQGHPPAVGRRRPSRPCASCAASGPSVLVQDVDALRLAPLATGRS